MAGFGQLRRLRYQGLPCRKGQSLVDRLAIDSRINSHVVVLRHEGISGPFTYGFFRPVVLLPYDAENWSTDALRRALRHELEHLRRADWLTHCLARIAGAVYWFHPLVWIAWRRLRLEAERACDDGVLLREDDVEYASFLVSVAERELPHAPNSALAMAARGDLSARIAAVLDKHQRRGRIGRYRTAVTIVTGLGLTVALSPLVEVTSAQRASAPSPKFEVVSVKVNKSMEAGKGLLTWRGNTFRATNVTLRTVLQFAYGPVTADGRSVRNLEPYRIVEGPSWIDTERFDIEARISDGQSSSSAISLMVRAALVDRFALKAYLEPRETSVYALVMARSDARLGRDLHPASGNCAQTRAELEKLGNSGIPCGVRFRTGTISAAGTSMGAFAFGLASIAGRLVVDQTALTGDFDFDLEFAQDPTPEQAVGNPPTEPVASLFTALQEQLGLKLESRKTPVEVLIVDQVSRPSEN